MKTISHPILRWAVVLFMVISLADPLLLTNVSAYSAATHARLVSDAWNVLVYLEKSPQLLNPIPGAPTNPAVLLSRERLAASLNFFRQKRSQFPPANGRWTSQSLTANPGAELLGDFITSPRRRYYREANPANTDSGRFEPGGIFARSCRTVLTNPPNASTTVCEQTGNLLGWWAGNVDDLHDTKASFKVQYVYGAGAIINRLDEALDKGLGFVAGILYCILTLGLDPNCWQAGHDIAEVLNPTDDIASLIPGYLGSYELAGHNLSSSWHFLNTSPSNPNQLGRGYDNNDGINTAFESHPIPSEIDVANIAYTTFAGITLETADSPTVGFYQIENGHDGHPNTDVREDFDYESMPLGLLTWNPADNMAKYGWERWKECQDIRSLGYLLHISGDVTVPMHVNSTLGWGHSGYEEFVKANYDRIIRFGIDGVADSIQVQDVLDVRDKIVELLQQIQAWRDADPARGRDINLRDLLTSVAQNTYSKSANFYYSTIADGTAATVDFFTIGKLDSLGSILYDDEEVLPKQFLRREFLHRSIALCATVLLTASEYYDNVVDNTRSCPIAGMPSEAAGGGARAVAGAIGAGPIPNDEQALRTYMDTNLEPSRVALLAKQITPEKFWDELDRHWYTYHMARKGPVDDLKLQATLVVNKELRRHLISYLNETIDGRDYLIRVRNVTVNAKRLARDRCFMREFVAGRDEDKDGVPDLFDRCPGTPAGTLVDARGCPQSCDIEPFDDAPVRKRLKSMRMVYSKDCLSVRESPPTPRWVYHDLVLPKPGVGYHWKFGWEPVEGCKVHYILTVTAFQLYESRTMTRVLSADSIPTVIGPNGRPVLELTAQQGVGLGGELWQFLIGSCSYQASIQALDGNGHYSDVEIHDVNSNAALKFSCH